MWAFAQNYSSGSSDLEIFQIWFYAIVLITTLPGLWKTYEKAGKPGWGAIIPIYSLILMLDIAERPRWWIILAFIPIVNLIISIMIVHQVSRRFGKGAWFTVGMLLLPPIFWSILGFGEAQYRQLGTDA